LKEYLKIENFQDRKIFEVRGLEEKIESEFEKQQAADLATKGLFESHNFVKKVEQKVEQKPEKGHQNERNEKKEAPQKKKIEMFDEDQMKVLMLKEFQERFCICFEKVSEILMLFCKS
jgi:hypothetical protein